MGLFYTIFSQLMVEKWALVHFIRNEFAFERFFVFSYCMAL
jgi:hypothetical protein